MSGRNKTRYVKAKRPIERERGWRENKVMKYVKEDSET